jgi:tetratricopeptide (TPR) repeat protein
MKAESIAFALSGTLFGLIAGWIIGSQNAVPKPAAPAATSAVAPAPPAQGRALDSARVSRLEQQANAEPSNAVVRTELANLYFDAERFDAAAPWYEAALKLDPSNVNVSTDLGVAYFSMGQADRALAQFDVSLKLDPKHVKTLLNQGIVRAFGKGDRSGAQESWERVVAIAPGSEEAARAEQGLAGIREAIRRAANGDATGPAASGATSSPASGAPAQ